MLFIVCRTTLQSKAANGQERQERPELETHVVSSRWIESSGEDMGGTLRVGSLYKVRD